MTRNDAVFQLNATVDHIRGDVAYDADGNEVAVDWDAAQALADTKVYQTQRMMEYPGIADQLDMLYHAIDTGTLDKTSDFYTTLKAVKDKYPK